MKLSNFELNAPFQAFELRGLGHDWDLHSFARLIAVRLPNESGTASLEWSVPSDVQNPWGSPGNTASGCRLVFSGVRMFNINAGDPAKAEDSRVVAGISKTVPGETEYPFRLEWKTDEPFHLKVEFEDEGSIDIDADVVTLEAIPRALNGRGDR